MGKLSDLWQELKETSDETRRKDIQRKINEIELFCIDKGYAGIKEKTDWTKYNKTKKVYRYENPRDAGYFIPDGARVGRDRCGCCKYNNHVYCGGDKPCFANV